ncbi:hypothetical protein F4859DRAFT_517375 [Xylaria cf. heliscus]|nr:hypothetical protein F4859DRAFT_517375 [Xylaria cf. heliscus]
MAAAPYDDHGGQITPKPETMMYIMNHVMLPPQLPQEDDYNPKDEMCLLSHVIEAFKSFRDIFQSDQAGSTESTELVAIQRALSMLKNLASIYDNDDTSALMNEKKLQDSFGQFDEAGRKSPLDILCVPTNRIQISLVAPIPLYVHAQNAGVIVSSGSNANDTIHFELFELSPQNKAVMKNAGRLQRAFPGCAIAVPREEVQDPSFLSTFTGALSKMTYQPAYGTVPKVNKAGQEHEEDRDTTHPKMVTELLAAYLRSIGEMVEVSSILKNTRQEVLWKDARSPWHRSALWLLIRVALQLFFSRQESEWVKEHAYKNYMLFFMAYMLEQTGTYKMSADLIWTAKAKVTRRRLKLEIGGYPAVCQYVDKVLSSTAAKIEEQWTGIQSDDEICHNFEDLKDLTAYQDTAMDLERLDEYLEAIPRRETCRQSAELHTSCPLPEFILPIHSSFHEFPSTTPIVFKLLKFESWVKCELDGWLASNPGKEQTCKELMLVIESYHECALHEYQGNCEAMSIMLLTIMQLWVALDKSAINCCNLLAEYAPNFPAALLQKLILAERCQMERLQSIEEYLKRRHSRAGISSDYVFHSYGNKDCFAVRYFNQSEEQKRLRSDIERRAKLSKDEKIAELDQKRNKYREHSTAYYKLECDYYWGSYNRHTGAYEKVHSRGCAKCSHKYEMDTMEIELHEWPLPRDENEAKTVVFELLVPSSFKCWRDSAIFILTDVLGLNYEPPDPPRSHYTTEDIKGLKGCLVGSGVKRRISLISEIKPHSCTHRKMKTVITASVEDICVDLGAAFRYFDNKKGVFVDKLTVTNYVTRICTFRLSAASNQLQQFLDDTIQPTKFSNTAISSQSKCPLDLSLEEYKAMASLRAGSKIRWHNVLKELASPSVDFRKGDTTLIILQCIQQAGQADAMNVLRETHSILDDERFSAALLSNLSDACSRISRNWQSAPALSAFISVASRVLSLSSNPKIQQSSLEILNQAREISINWVEMLKQKSQNATEDRVRNDFILKSAFVALICADSFNVDPLHMREILSVPKQAKILIRSSIIVQESQHAIVAEPQSLTGLLYHRWKQLCLRSFPILAKLVEVEGSPALDYAIESSWATYQPIGNWKALEAPYEHWMYSKSASNEHENALIIQFSMLTGELLVNGVPLNRLPKEYEKNPAYQILFGKSTIEVMPSPVKGMRFSAKQAFAGHSLHFNLSTEQNTLSSEKYLLVRASTPDLTLELISPSLFRNCFPISFVDDFVHWYNVKENCVEFRPRHRAWVSSKENWKLCRDGEAKAWRLNRGERSLVNVHSTTATRFCEVFKPLEDELYIHVMFLSNTTTVEIHLPRIQLGFSTTLGDASIKSHQHRGMVVHEHQKIQTLIGLKSKLVLKSNKANSRDKVIIPNGKVSCWRAGDHIHVGIDKTSSTKTHVYEIDQQLGRVVDNGTLTSKLFLAYLHGLTSFCLPDPLTGSTGTNAALSILRSSAVRSFPSLSQDDANLLVDIAQLTPEREYYPHHLQEMETVEWSLKLGFLAQHIGYNESVKSLSEHFRRFHLFYPENCVEFSIFKIDKVLLQREKIRSAAVRAWDFGAECHTKQYDKVYKPRDCAQNSSEAIMAHSLSTMVFRGEPNPQGPMKHDIGQHVWEFLLKHRKTITSRPPSSPGSFRYDASFLIESSQMIAKDFLTCLRALKAEESQLDKYRIMMWLTTLSFAEDPDMTVLQTLASFFICPRMNTIDIPYIPDFDLRDGLILQADDVKDKVLASTHDFASSPEAALEKHERESPSKFYERRSRIFNENKSRTVDGFVGEIMKQWPYESPWLPPHVESYRWEAYINVDKVMSYLQSLFLTLHNNRRLKGYLHEVANNMPLTSVTLNAVVRIPMATKPADRASGFVRTNDLFSGSAPLQRQDTALLPSLLTRLQGIIDPPYKEGYMESLRGSSLALRKLECRYDVELPSNNVKVLVSRRDSWKDIVDKAYFSMKDAVTKLIHERLHTHDGKVELGLLQHFPQPSQTFFLRFLSRNKWNSLSEDWKFCLTHYGVALTQLQRANRLLDAIDNPTFLEKELRNRGHENWDPYEYPESLLIEIEGGILIRKVQEQIACEMRNPPSNNNAVMQLNMGEGKSSVIVPIVAASLADTTRLVRVIVAKPQSKQMLQMLVAKLGGLLNRQIYHLPFSRAVDVDESSTRAIRGILEECMQSGGILLTQPENILSFMLMGIESCISGKSETSQSLTKTLGFLDTYSRDIVDESDENFSVKFELLYTMGLQRPIEWSPERWICVQRILTIFGKIVPQLKDEFPSSIEIHSQQDGGFPRIRILQKDVERHILVRIAEEVCSKGLGGFPIVWQGKEFRQAVSSYIADVQPLPEVIDMVENDNPTGFWAKSREALLLLRGLLAGGILSFCFRQKRWRVDYGLDPNRKPKTKLALPFRAKDSPTPRSEFSHPEVVIVLTQLSYYYGGLCNEEIDWALRHLLNSDQADAEFQAWVQGAAKLATEFKQISGINLDDRSTCEEEIFPHLRFSQGAINYYLSKSVFPKEMKEFPYKLSASGWDIGKTKTLPTTGFSGTNDSRYVLPLSVNQLALPEQQHTNTLVLKYLLQPENSVELLPSRVEQNVSDAKMLLDMVIRMDPPVRVILDVGAQILELDNLGVARDWLSRFRNSEGTEAVVFFNEHDELSVLDLRGGIEPLQVSPYINQLDLCLVFLDQAHTRGTELKLPLNYRAAVTLGAGLTKDRLVQACMRMRLLGQGQSVIFCVPQEIVAKIEERFLNIHSGDEHTISVSDILAWAITETWHDTEHSIPLWAAQGRRHERHKSLWTECHEAGDVLTKELAENFLEDEAKSLEERYRPLREQDGARAISESDDAITRHCQQFNNIISRSTDLQEEQERELAPEIEQERQDERPPLAQPKSHTLHQDVRDFAATGRILGESDGYMHAFKSLRGTTAASLFDVSQFRPGLLVSTDFAQTVEISNSADKADGYQRPVQWILTASEAPDGEVKWVMIISPYEANELVSDIRKSSCVALHLYSPRPNLEYRPLDRLDLYTVPETLKDRRIPRRFITELNLFAGQLYITSFDEYIDICKFLGLPWEPAGDGQVIGADGFIHLGGESGLSASPVEFFKLLFTKIRRNCETIDKTHMGKILDNQLLSREDFE